MTWLPPSCGTIVVKLPEGQDVDRPRTSLAAIVSIAYQMASQVTMTARMLEKEATKEMRRQVRKWGDKQTKGSANSRPAMSDLFQV